MNSRELHLWEVEILCKGAVFWVFVISFCPTLVGLSQDLLLKCTSSAKMDLEVKASGRSRTHGLELPSEF